MEQIDSACQELTEGIDRMLSLLDATPDERITWRPSESARTILEVASHAAHALANIVTQMRGTPFPIPTSKEADAGFRAYDRTFTTREQVKAELIKGRDLYIGLLRELGEAGLDQIVTLPFGMGQAPIRAFVGAGPRHTFGHIAQIEYIQTIYGDHDWHFGF